MLTLLRTRGPRRRLLLSHLQSSLGTAAGYIALLVLAYDRLHSPWAIALVLTADFLPSVLLAPLAGTLADRFSPRRVMALADVVRAVAFFGVAAADGFAGTVGFALLAGAGTTLYRPASKCALPALAGPDRLGSAVGTWGALDEIGTLAGPVIAAALFALAGAADVVRLNAATFAIAAVVALTLPEVTARAERTAGGVLRHLRDGLHALRTTSGVRVLLAASMASVTAGALMNVVEPLLARGPLHAGPQGFALLVGLFSAGAVGASAWSAREDELGAYRRRYLMGFVFTAAGLLLSALAPSLLVAGISFTVTGFGSGLSLVHEQQLLQRAVPEHVRGRIFGFKDSADATAFVAAFALSAALAASLGPRAVFALSGAAVALAGLGAAWGLRDRGAAARGEAVAAAGSPPRG
jgi:MFS family permease